MAQFKTSEYPAKTVFNDGDLYDVSTFNGVSYASQKMTFAELKAELNAQLTNNLGNSNQTLTGARTVTQGGFDLTFTGANVGFGVTPTAGNRIHVNGNAQIDGITKANDHVEIASGKALYMQGTGTGFIRFNGDARFMSAGVSGTGQQTTIATPANNERINFKTSDLVNTIGCFLQNGSSGNEGAFAVGKDFITPTSLVHIKTNAGSNSSAFRIETSGNSNAISVNNNYTTGSPSTNNGFVGLGLATAQEQLHVNGRVQMDNQTAPSTPTGGGIIYVESGALKYIGSSGTITTLGVA